MKGVEDIQYLQWVIKHLVFSTVGSVVEGQLYLKMILFHKYKKHVFLYTPIVDEAVIKPSDFHLCANQMLRSLSFVGGTPWIHMSLSVWKHEQWLWMVYLVLMCNRSVSGESIKNLHSWGWYTYPNSFTRLFTSVQKHNYVLYKKRNQFFIAITIKCHCCIPFCNKFHSLSQTSIWYWQIFD